MIIQQYTEAIGLVQNDGAENKQDIVKTQPTTEFLTIADSEGSSNLEELTTKETVESYVEEQARRGTSGKTNSHILSDADNDPNSLGSTPLHLSNNPTSSEIAEVRSEIAQIQSDIADVKKGMVEMQRQHATTPSPAHHSDPRPQSTKSDKTFIYENEIDCSANQAKSGGSTPKTVLKPKPDAVTPTTLIDTDDDEIEGSLENDDFATSQGMDEVDQSPEFETYDRMSDSGATISREIEIDEDYDRNIDAENIEYEQAFSPAQEDLSDIYQRTPSKVKRQPPLKRSHKVTPVKNAMPNIHQQSTVPGQMKTQKSNNVLYPTTLKRFDRPKDAIQTCLAQLDSSSWENVMDGLKMFIRLIRHHPEAVDSQIHLMTLALSKHVRNLRSQVSRAGSFFFSESRFYPMIFFCLSF